MKKQPTSDRKPLYLLILAGVGLLAVIAALSALCMPLFSKLSDPAVQEQLRAWIDSLGFGGWLIVLGIQILQIVIAFIPGEPVELLAGVLYGPWGGLLTCLFGILISSSCIFLAVRRYGYPFVVRLFGKEKLDEFKFLNDAKKIETVTFILFLIPGTPKDMLTYAAGISRIKAGRFLLISTFARIPSVITSTILGSSVSRGDWTTSVLIFLVIAAIGLFGILYKDKIMARMNTQHPNEAH